MSPSLPDSPVFFTHLSYQRRKELAEVGKSLRAETPTTGLLLDAGAVPLDGVKAQFKTESSADPVLLESDQFGVEKKHRVPMAPWVQHAAPSTRAEWDSAIRDSLKTQRQMGLKILSVPGVELSSSDIFAGLQMQLEAARLAWRNRPDGEDHWFVRVTLHDDWLLHPTALRLALNLLTDLPDGLDLSIRLRFAKRDGFSKADTLFAVRHLVESLARDGRRVLMIQSGLLGWLSLAWGAWGVSAGMSQASWFDSRETIRRRAGSPSPARVERFFEPSLLHPVLYVDHKKIADGSGYTACVCMFCQKMGSTWSAKLTDQHGLHALASLVGDLDSTTPEQRRLHIRRTIEKAQTRAADLAERLDLNARSQPKHLSTWRAVVGTT